MNELKIEDLKKVKLDKDDVLVLCLKEMISENASNRIKKIISSVFPNNKLLILDGDSELKVVKDLKGSIDDSVEKFYPN